MTTYEYLNSMGDDNLKKLVRNGIISAKMLTYMKVYKYHVQNGEKRSLTMEHFKMPIASVGYALQRMKQPIQ